MQGLCVCLGTAICAERWLLPGCRRVTESCCLRGCAVLSAQAARPDLRRRVASAQVSLAGSVLLRAAALGAGAAAAANGFITDGATPLAEEFDLSSSAVLVCLCS